MSIRRLTFAACFIATVLASLCYLGAIRSSAVWTFVLPGVAIAAIATLVPRNPSSYAGLLSGLSCGMIWAVAVNGLSGENLGPVARSTTACIAGVTLVVFGLRRKEPNTTMIGHLLILFGALYYGAANEVWKLALVASIFQLAGYIGISMGAQRRKPVDRSRREYLLLLILLLGSIVIVLTTSWSLPGVLQRNDARVSPVVINTDVTPPWDSAGTTTTSVSATTTTPKTTTTSIARTTTTAPKTTTSIARTTTTAPKSTTTSIARTTTTTPKTTTSIARTTTTAPKTTTTIARTTTTAPKTTTTIARTTTTTAPKTTTTSIARTTTTPKTTTTIARTTTTAPKTTTTVDVKKEQKKTQESRLWLWIVLVVLAMMFAVLIRLIYVRMMNRSLFRKFTSDDNRDSIRFSWNWTRARLEQYGYETSASVSVDRVSTSEQVETWPAEMQAGIKELADVAELAIFSNQSLSDEQESSAWNVSSTLISIARNRSTRLRRVIVPFMRVRL